MACGFAQRTNAKEFQVRLLLLVLPFLVLACTHRRPWQDPCAHTVHFVTVEDRVRLEVLDWGGSGRPIILLAGSGNTAHVYDDFAEKLAGPYHVYGITRRGFGASDHPSSGYTDQRLADDVLAVLNSLKIPAPVLIGHSMAGSELSTVANRHSDQLSGLVYLDAARDPTLDALQIDPIRKKLPLAMLQQPEPAVADTKSFQAYREWQKRTGGTVFPEAELRNCYAANPDGSMGDYKTDSAVFDAISAGVKKRDYWKIRVPVLAFVTLPSSPSNLSPGNYQPKNEQERIAMQDSYEAMISYIKQDEKRMRDQLPSVRIVEMPGAEHHVFLSNEADVLRELRPFLAGLK